MASLASLIKLPLVTAGIAFLSLVTPTSSMAFTLKGTTVGQRTYDRPAFQGENNTIVFNAPFAVNSFTVPTNGVYNFNTTAPGFDYVQSLYENNFDPTNPRANLFGGFSSRSINSNFSLTTATDYFLVTSVFVNTRPGDFSTNITRVPESSGVLGTLAFGAIGGTYLLKRKSKKIAI
jgi:hypothetical protein